MVHYEGEQGAERCVRVERLSGNNAVYHFEGKAGVERLVRHEWPCGGVSYFEGGRDAEVLVRRELPMGIPILWVSPSCSTSREMGGCRAPLGGAASHCGCRASSYPTVGWSTSRARWGPQIGIGSELCHVHACVV